VIEGEGGKVANSQNVAVSLLQGKLAHYSMHNLDRYGEIEGSFGFGGGDAMLVMDANGEISNVDYDASINDPDEEDEDQ